MKFRIHYELANGDEDSIVIEGDTLDDIRQKAGEEVAKRSGQNPWSEELN